MDCASAGAASADGLILISAVAKTVTNLASFNVLTPPIAHHRRCDLLRIADWPRLRLHDLMATLAGTALGVASLVWTDATSVVFCLAFQHDLLSDARIR